MEWEVGEGARAAGRMKADGFGRYDKSDIRLVVCGCGVGLREGEEERLELAFFGSFVVSFKLHWLWMLLVIPRRLQRVVICRSGI